MQPLTGAVGPELFSFETAVWMAIALVWLGAARLLSARLPLQNIIVATLVLAGTRLAIESSLGRWGMRGQFSNHSWAFRIQMSVGWAALVLNCRCLAGAILNSNAAGSRRGFGQWLLTSGLAAGAVLLLRQTLGIFPPPLAGGRTGALAAVIGFELSLVLLGLVLATPWLVKARPAEKSLTRSKGPD